MTIYYNAQDGEAACKGNQRVHGERTPVYMRTPTYAYRIDYFTVTREI